MVGEALAEKCERPNQGAEILHRAIDRGSQDEWPASRKILLGRTIEAADSDWVPNTVNSRLPAIAVMLEDIVFDRLRNCDYRVALSQRYFVASTHPQASAQWPVFREMYVLQIVKNSNRAIGAND